MVVGKIARITVRGPVRAEMDDKEREYQLDRVNAFVKRLRGFLRKRPGTKQDLDDLIADLNVHLFLLPLP